MNLIELGGKYNRAAWGLRDCSEGRHHVIYAMQDLIHGHAKMASVTDYEVMAALCLEMGRYLSKHDSMKETRELIHDVFTKLHAE